MLQKTVLQKPIPQFYKPNQPRGESKEVSGSRRPGKKLSGKTFKPSGQSVGAHVHNLVTAL